MAVVTGRCRRPAQPPSDLPPPPAGAGAGDGERIESAYGRIPLPWWRDRRRLQPLTAAVGIGSFTLARDGRRLIYSKISERSNIHRLVPSDRPASLAEVEAVTAGNHLIEFLDFSRDGETVYGVGTGGDGSLPNLWAISLPEGRVRALTDFRSPTVQAFQSFAVAGGEIYFLLREQRGDLWLAELE